MLKKFLDVRWIALVVMVPFLLSATAWAVPITLVPTGLSVGDKYHLAFVTSTIRDALSSDIDDYNAFVNAAADAVGIGPNDFTSSPIGAINWYAIASTATVHARDNAMVSAPVYRLDDTLVATDFADMWDGALQNPLNLDETGSFRAGWLAWTGSLVDGFGSPTDFLGPHFPEHFQCVTGHSSAYILVSPSLWIANFSTYSYHDYAFYALSEELTVIPEPSTLVLMSCGLLGLLGICVKRRRKVK